MSPQAGTLFDMLGTEENERRQKSRARSIDNLSQLGGLAANPQSPMAAGTAGLGITPDQAKMAGSSAQLAAATPLAPPKVDSATSAAQGALPEQKQALEATRAQAATAPNQQALELKAFATDWESKVGTFAHRINENAAAAMVAPMTQAGAGKVVMDQALLQGKDPATAATITSQFDALNAATTEAERNAAIDALETSIGSDGSLSTAIMNSLEPGMKSAYAAYVASKTPDKLTLDMVNAVSGGELDAVKLADALGIDTGVIGGMKLSDIKNAINTKLQSAGGTTDKLKAALNDSNLSATDRADIRQQLRDAGEMGIAATDAELKDLEASVKTAGTITLPNGESANIEDLMADDNIKTIVSAYINGDAEAGAAMPEPFKKWVDNNRNLIDAAYWKAAKDSKDWNAFESEQDTVASVFAANPSVLKDLKSAVGLPADGPTYDRAAWGKLTTSGLVAPILDAYNNGGADGKTRATNMINAIATASDFGVSLTVTGVNSSGEPIQVPRWSAEQLDAMGYSSDPLKWGKSMEVVKAADSGDPDKLWSALIPPDTLGQPSITPTELNAKLRTAGAASAWLGTDAVAKPELLRLLDTDGNNEVSADELKAAASDPTKTGLLAGLTPDKFNAIPSPALAATGPLGQKLFDALSDGYIDDEEFKRVMIADSTLLTPDNVMRLLGAPGMEKKAGLLGAAVSELTEKALRPAVTEFKTAQAEYDEVLAKKPKRPVMDMRVGKLKPPAEPSDVEKGKWFGIAGQERKAKFMENYNREKAAYEADHKAYLDMMAQYHKDKAAYETYTDKQYKADLAAAKRRLDTAKFDGQIGSAYLRTLLSDLNTVPQLKGSLAAALDTANAIPAK